MKTEAEMRKIELGRRCIPYALHRTARKNLRVVVNPDLSVAVYAPTNAEMAEIERGMVRKAPWIAKTLDRVETYHPLPSPKRCIGVPGAAARGG